MVLSGYGSDDLVAVLVRTLLYVRRLPSALVSEPFFNVYHAEPVILVSRFKKIFVFSDRIDYQSRPKESHKVHEKFLLTQS